MDEKFFRNVDGALGHRLGNESQDPFRFGGKPGEPVPEVDPEDVKTVWQLFNDAEARHPGSAIGLEVLRQVCRPEANVEAATYRTMLLGVMSQIAPEHLARFMRDGQPGDSVFRAAAKVPVEWRGEGQWQSAPFDLNEFLRLCGEESQTA